MIPGSNLLRSALRLLGNQTVILYRYAGRVTTDTGRDVSAFSPPITHPEGSVQPLPRARYADLGLDYSKSAVTWFVPTIVQGVERDRSPDKFVFGSRLYEVHAVTPWNLQDGWNEVVGVDVGPSSEAPIVAVEWSDIDNVPSNIQEAAELATSGIVVRKADGDWVTSQYFVLVESLADLPAPSGNVITLAANVTYFIAGTIDLAGLQIVASQNTTIIGGSSENSKLTSTGLSSEVPFITSQWSLPMRNLTIEAATAISLNATANPNQAIDWFGVNFTNCENVGTIGGYNNFIMTDCALLNSANMYFDGSVGTAGFNQCLFSGRAGNPTIRVFDSAVISRRFRVVYSAFVTPSAGVGVNFGTGASVPVEGYILDTCNFSGDGAAISGVQHTDNKALFVNCKGVPNTAALANYWMLNNATATDIVNPGEPVKVAGTTTASANTQKYIVTDNNAEYTGGIDRDVYLSGVASVSASAPNLQIALYFAKNGAVIPESEIIVTSNSLNRSESVAFQSIATVSPGDDISVWVSNETNNTDVTVSHLNVTIVAG